jgi:hypothetical protein
MKAALRAKSIGVSSSPTLFRISTKIAVAASRRITNFREGHSWESSGIYVGPASNQSTARRECQLTVGHLWRSNDSKWPVSDRWPPTGTERFRLRSVRPFQERHQLQSQDIALYFQVWYAQAAAVQPVDSWFADKSASPLSVEGYEYHNL